MITAEQFQEWKTHPVTKEIFEELKQVKNALTDQLTDGSFLDYDAEYFYGVTNRVVGQIRGIDQLLNISYKDDKEDTDNIDFQSGY